MDFSLTPEQQAFRQTVRAWLRDHIPSQWKHVGSSELPRVEAYELLREWQRRLYDAGFIGLTWPKEYGGHGLTFMEELIVHEEMALRQITGEAEFNEVFFDSVRVHESEVLGGVNNGWQVGITTLMYERLTLGFGLQMRLRIALDSLIELARRMEKHGRVITKDPLQRTNDSQLSTDNQRLPDPRPR